MLNLQKKAYRGAVGALVLAALAGAAVLIPLIAQTRPPMTPEEKEKRWNVENELASLAVIERKVMIPMRDGVRIAADVYRPRDASKRYPAIWVRTPYNFNSWDVENGVPQNLTAALEAVRRGYAYVIMQERGQFFSEGEWDVLGGPFTDAADEAAWMIGRPWSNGRVGTTGCSSTAEWQIGAVARDIPGWAAFNAQGFGCGVGRIGPFYEQGNWYRGGAFMLYNVPWFYTNEKPLRPMFPPETSTEDLIRLSKSWDLAAKFPPVDWKNTYAHLPVQDMLRSVDAPKKVFEAMIRRTPNDPAWYEGVLFHDDMRINVPGLWFMSYYDIAIAANLEMYNFVRKTAKGEAADQQWAIIAPVGHCAFTRATEHTIVGERDMGDARLAYQDIMYGFFDRFLKGEPSPVLDALPKVTYYTMGSNVWHGSDTWPPKEVRPMTFFLESGGKANTLHGDGVLVFRAPSADRPDRFTYDPLDPVPTHGGYRSTNNVGGPDGSYDQRTVEERPDVLVYTSAPFAEGLEITGTMTPTLYVSSDVKDTDFTVKVIDVYPDGRAFTLDESIQRMRWRDGYDKPPVWMEPGKVTKVVFLPLITSNFFEAGHRLRVEISSSSFPEYERNLNTGGNNYDETAGIVAHNAVHHSVRYPSALVVTVMKRPKS
jgi:putative CocE/NonD family hydrolase